MEKNKFFFELLYKYFFINSTIKNKLKEFKKIEKLIAKDGNDHID
jgi:hypothetical protein